MDAPISSYSNWKFIFFADIFGSLRASIYDDEVWKWVLETTKGIENIGNKLVNSKDNPPTFEKPTMKIEKIF